MTSENQAAPDGQSKGRPVDETLLAEVQDVVLGLTKTLKIFRTYPRENTISINAIDEWVETLSRFLGTHKSLELFVERHELQWQGVAVYSETDQRRSFALKLDRDGVRRIVFYHGIDRNEVVGLLESLTTDVDEESLDDDLVTILWEKQLTHVKVYVLDDLSTADGGFDSDLVESGQPAEGTDEQGEEGSTRSAPGPGGGPGEEGSLDPSVQIGLCAATKAKIHPVTDQQAALLRELTEKEASHDVSVDLTDILFDLLGSKNDDQLCLNALKVLLELVMMHVRGIAFGRAADILGKLRAFAANEEVGKDIRAQIVAQFQSLAIESRLETIVEALGEHEDISRTELSRFLMMLPAAAAPGLCDLMALPQYDTVVRAVLKHLVKDDPSVLTSKLSGSDVAMATKVLAILEQVAEPALAQALVDPLMAAETPVKTASVKLLERLKGTPCRDLLLAYVASDDASLRKAALKALAGFGEASGPAAPLREQAALKDFDQRTLDEKKTLLVTLARLESRHAVGFLEGILADRRWFEKTDHAETRACAALALGEIDTEEARAALQRHTSDKSEPVRTAARLALGSNTPAPATIGSAT